MGFQQSLTSHKSLNYATTAILAEFCSYPFLYAGVPGWSFCGLCLQESAAHPDGRLDRDCPRRTIRPLDFARYFLTVFIIRQFTVVWVILRRGGRRRLSPAATTARWVHVASHLSERFARLPFALSAGSSVFNTLPQAFGCRVWGIFLLFVLSMWPLPCAFSSIHFCHWPSGLSRLTRLRNSGFCTYFFRPQSRRWKCFLSVCGSSAGLHFLLDSSLQRC